MTVDATAHWNQVYASKSADRVSWYAPHLRLSLDLIAEARLPADAAMLDVGAGASTLATDLLDLGYRDITVLDIAQTALDALTAQAGAKASQLTSMVGDITKMPLPRNRYDLWHDRAVFHFLTDRGARDAYLAQVEQALKPGGHLIIGTFGPHGPEHCSGLDVAHYDAETLPAVFARTFTRVRCALETHSTPWGTSQEFVYCLCRKAS